MRQRYNLLERKLTILCLILRERNRFKSDWIFVSLFVILVCVFQRESHGEVTLYIEMDNNVWITIVWTSVYFSWICHTHTPFLSAHIHIYTHIQSLTQRHTHIHRHTYIYNKYRLYYFFYFIYRLMFSDGNKLCMNIYTYLFHFKHNGILLFLYSITLLKWILSCIISKNFTASQIVSQKLPVANENWFHVLHRHLSISEMRHYKDLFYLYSSNCYPHRVLSHSRCFSRRTLRSSLGDIGWIFKQIIGVHFYNYT